MDNNQKLLDISWASVLKIAFIFLMVYLLFLLRDILILLLFALVFSVLFEPAIKFLQKFKIPRVLAAGLIYLLVFAILAGSIYLFSWPLMVELKQFVSLFGQYFEKLSPILKSLGVSFFENFESFTTVLEDWLRNASSSFFAGLSALFGGLFSTLTVFFLSFFLSLEEKGIEKFIRIFFPKKYDDFIFERWQIIEQKITGWFGARLLCCLFVGVTTFLVLKIFKIDYALSLSLFAGVSNIIFYVGPILAGFLITLIAFLQDWLKAIFVLVAFFLIQQIESNLLNPLLTKKFIGLPAVLVLVSLIIGGKLFGFLGILLGIPLGGVLYEFTVEFLKKKREEEEVVIL